MATVQQIVDNILNQLSILAPDMSAEIGTPERKLVEAVAEQIAQASVDFEVLNAQHDLDTMTGNRLDSFLSNFGFGRQQPTRGTGSVTFSRLSSASDSITIPRGTQVVARQSDIGFASIFFATTATVVLQGGSTSVDAAIEATVPGTFANLPANSINAFGGPQTVPGISSVTNAAPTSGGLDGETDAELKVRFKNTVFRNQSGTEDQFLALSVSTPFTSKANVVGPISRYIEYIQVPDNVANGGFGDDRSQINPLIDPTGTIYPHKRTSAVSTIPYSKFTYDENVYLSNGEFGSDAIFYRANVDFLFNNPRVADGDATGNVNGIANHQPNITILTTNINADANDQVSITPGQVLLLEHAYMSQNSRNDYLKGILNCIDIFIDGKNDVPVISNEVMPGSNFDFIFGPTDIVTSLSNYKRTLDASRPTSSNRLQVLFWQPISDLPDTIDIGSNRYYKARYVKYNTNGTVAGYYFDEIFTQPAHYWVIQETTDLYGTIRARNGVEWSSSEPGVLIDPTDTPKPATLWAGHQFVIENYFYDQNVGDLQAIVEKNKQITTDVLVHQARRRYFKLYITVMYAPGSSSVSVNSSIASEIDAFFQRQFFGTVIQMSDLLQVIHNVPGVDNVRWSSDIDITLPKVEEVQPNGRSLSPVKVYSSDFFLQDSELPALPTITSTDVTAALVIKKRAQNTWIPEGR